MIILVGLKYVLNIYLSLKNNINRIKRKKCLIHKLLIFNQILFIINSIINSKISFKYQ